MLHHVLHYKWSIRASGYHLLLGLNCNSLGTTIRTVMDEMAASPWAQNGFMPKAFDMKVKAK